MSTTHPASLAGEEGHSLACRYPWWGRFSEKGEGSVGWKQTSESFSQPSLHFALAETQPRFQGYATGRTDSVRCPSSGTCVPHEGNEQVSGLNLSSAFPIFYSKCNGRGLGREGPWQGGAPPRPRAKSTHSGIRVTRASVTRRGPR